MRRFFDASGVCCEGLYLVTGRGAKGGMAGKGRMKGWSVWGGDGEILVVG